MKLNVWQRLGIALSILTLSIAPILLWLNTAREAQATQRRMRDKCLEFAGNDFESGKICTDAFIQYGGIVFWPLWREIAQLTAIGVIIIWVIAYIATYTVRWILAGKKM